ncbi:MAG TPA: YCF48-related protein [Pirellulaceae bacterium]|nr:YCF48-related protein [Pirellulaceae bacterium]
MRLSRLLVLCWTICVVLIVALAGVHSANAEPLSSSPEMLEDAELTDVQFIGVSEGWAVGDRGAIWKTEDAGRHWQLTDSPVNCRLESVHFIDESQGWAVGGWIHPLTHKTSAVVLYTDNGGRRWKRLNASTLPSLRHVTFFDQRNGWVVGSSSAMYRSGVFRTRDGGRSWTAVPAERIGHWLGAYFFDDRQGIVVGRDSAVAGVTAGMMRRSQKPVSDWKPMRDVTFIGEVGWSVGDGGRVWRSGNHGASWQRVLLPEGVARQFDFRAIATVDAHIWIAGAPGTSVLHSADAGQSWELFDTGQRMPLAALSFVDAQHGWAVGAMGTTLVTQDGGRTWRSQRGESRRAALLTVVSEPQRIPFEMLARLGGDEGYLAAVEIMSRRDIEASQKKESSAAERSQAAVSELGGSFSEASWQFPLRQRGLKMPAEAIIAGWNIVNDNQGIARMEELVIRKIRQWQPDVIVTENASPDMQDPLAHVINQIVLAAVRRAADPKAFPDQLAVAQLAPWKVKKVFGVLPGDHTGTVTLQTSRLATRLGSSLADQAARTRGLVFDRWQPSPTRLGFELLINETSNKAGTRDFFSGLMIEPGVSRRHATNRSNEDLESLTNAARRRRTVDQLLARNRQDPTAGISWLAQLDDLTRGLDSNAACMTLYELSQSYLAGGHHDLAADVMRSLVTNHPDHALTESVLVWLIQYHASGEIANRETDRNRQTRNPVPVLSGGGVDLEPSKVRFDNANPTDRSVFQLASRQNASGSAGLVSQRAANVFALAKQVRQSRPTLFAEPSIQFAIASAHRESRQLREANHLFAGLVRSHRVDMWSQCARGELWLANGKGLPPKTLLKCENTASKPKLDGTLDDGVWQDRQTVPIRSRLKDDEAWPTEVMLAHDNEFLYVAARCAIPSGVEYEVETQPRPRDPDLSHHDRIDVLIDIDRDFATYYRLTIDHRGWVGDACWGDTTWDPQWFVAARSDRNEWVVEAAIPLAALHSGPLPRAATWAVGIQRTVPGIGFQSWTKPAATEPDPAGFGYLQFQ